MDQPGIEERIAAVRRFNRFYTRQIGLLQEGLLKSPFSLPEARVLYELAEREEPTASTLAKDLGLDPGYLSRILRQFQRRGLLRRRPSPRDGRQTLLTLTDRGRQAASTLDARSREDVGAMLQALPGGEQERLVKGMRAVLDLLSPRVEGRLPYVLRPPEPGEYGLIIHLHGALYAREYDWDETFEALVADIVARYARKHDPKRERCWIAERDGELVGCVMLVRKAPSVAQLRLLLVDPRARGLGIGRRLVAECVRFARAARYKKMVLWTNDVLHAARHLYEEVGFRRTEAERHRSFGHDLMGETWELTL